MKKIIASLALLSCAFSVNAESFAVSPCSSQVVTIATNSLNTKQFATNICINKDVCGQKMATVNLVPTCRPSVTPVAVKCDPCAKPVILETSCNPCDTSACCM
jgi:hypothetical protein